jgi:hypothetical protein
MPKKHKNRISSEDNPDANNGSALIYHNKNGVNLDCEHAEIQSDHALATDPTCDHAET